MEKSRSLPRLHDDGGTKQSTRAQIAVMLEFLNKLAGFESPLYYAMF